MVAERTPRSVGPNMGAGQCSGSDPAPAIETIDARVGEPGFEVARRGHADAPPAEPAPRRGSR